MIFTSKTTRFLYPICTASDPQTRDRLVLIAPLSYPTHICITYMYIHTRRDEWKERSTLAERAAADLGRRSPLRAEWSTFWRPSRATKLLQLYTQTLPIKLARGAHASAPLYIIYISLFLFRFGSFFFVVVVVFLAAGVVGFGSIFLLRPRERERGRQRTRRNYRFVGAAKNIGEKFGSFLRARWWEYVVFVILYRWRELFSRGKIYFELLVVRSGKGVIWGFMRSVIIVIEWVVTGLATKVYAHIMK